MMRQLVVHTTSPTPPYEQIRAQLDDLIRSGGLAAGQRLPPVRQLAADLGLAVGTVARAYRELELTGQLRSRRGGGTRVADAPASNDPAERQRALDAQADLYVAAARRLGATDEELTASVHRAVLPTMTHTDLRRSPAAPTRRA
jgi:DNA-binding transcriptional regulator YhcF (GntR family)